MSKTEEYLESIYKDAYSHEIERSDKLDAQVGVPTAIITVLLGVTAFYFDHMGEISQNPFEEWFHVSLIVFGACLLSAMICLFLSYHHHDYEIIPWPQHIEDKIEEYRIYCGEDEEVDTIVRDKLRFSILHVYKKSITTNRESNLNRTFWMYWTTRCIVFAVVALIVSRAFFQLAKDSRVKPQEVKIMALPQVEALKIEVTKPPEGNP